MRLLRVGQIINAHGIRGELRVYPLTDYKERFEELEYVYIEGVPSLKYDIQKVRYKNELVVLKLKGIEDRNAAEALKEKYLIIDETQMRELPEDTYFIADLIGMEVYSETNERIGTLINVIQSTGQDLYEILVQENPSKTALIPAVKEFIVDVDVDQKRMTIKLIEGLIE
ncbi:MAG TPA: 16S rRNA processing protein RimM [Clostridiales bacterium]|nr:16S rRNA processing protein RimM [Clostridiales bacterium]